MATQYIAWNDGTTDRIALEYDSTTGNQTVTVTSDANNTYNDRSKTVTFRTTAGGSPKAVILTIHQQSQQFFVTIDSDTVTIDNDTIFGD